MRPARRLSDLGRSRGRYYFRIIGDVLFHVPLRATSYITNVQSELKMAADSSQQSIFLLFDGKGIRSILFGQKGTVLD